MRTLKDYINESILLEVGNIQLKTVNLEDVKVIYDGPIEYYIQAPINYSESDLQIYLEDVLLPKLPGSMSNASKYFGANADSISNRYIEYDSIVLSEGNAPRIDLNWDSTDGEVQQNAELVVFQVKNLKYVIEFDTFKLQNVTEDNYNSKLESIFMASIPSDVDGLSLPIRISLNPSNILATRAED